MKGHSVRLASAIVMLCIASYDVVHATKSHDGPSQRFNSHKTIVHPTSDLTASSLVLEGPGGHGQVGLQKPLRSLRSMLRGSGGRLQEEEEGEVEEDEAEGDSTSDEPTVLRIKLPLIGKVRVVALVLTLMSLFTVFFLVTSVVCCIIRMATTPPTKRNRKTHTRTPAPPTKVHNIDVSDHGAFGRGVGRFWTQEDYADNARRGRESDTDVIIEVERDEDGAVQVVVSNEIAEDTP